MQLRSAIAVAVASGYSSNWIPSLGTSICRGFSPKETKKPKKKGERERVNKYIFNPYIGMERHIEILISKISDYKTMLKTYKRLECSV